jgi:hypothetical protein
MLPELLKFIILPFELQSKLFRRSRTVGKNDTTYIKSVILVASLNLLTFLCWTAF